MCHDHSWYHEHRRHGNKLLQLTLHILSEMYSTLKGFWLFFIQDTSVLDSHFIQLAALPDDGLVTPKAHTCRGLWSM
jgi:hypothetical protein